ncbi:hypothetical protein [Nonomuraea zeae]|uniref:Lipid droplet-associated protein n=1 Tax=Nonomuraea zeae TaxID=1642303 RepID=A0A5S4GHF3_9ACTN|nr:hypothetical protein [Nonomuraea zeae]TMR32279.1 hypothetical protein ETD85_23085 [Nonomuraea zeae]
MSLSDVIRNIAKTVTNKDELKEKAKDLPLLVVQTTLSAAGQALLLVDRMKNSIKGIGSKEEREEEQYDSRPSAAEQVAAPVAADEDKPARKEPVIFAPRPSAAEPNGSAKAKPDPVIFTPAGKTETKAEEAKTAEAKPAEPVVEAKPAEAKAAEAKAAEAKAAEAKPAEPVVGAKPAEPAVKAAEPVVEPVAEEAPSVAPEPVSAPEATAAPEPVASVPVNLAEPLPGYSELTVASLRARMRGKSAEQIGDFLAFERATAARPEVIKMFENRLAKLQADA